AIKHEKVVRLFIAQFTDPIRPVVEVCYLFCLAVHVADEVIEACTVAGHGQGDRCGTGLKEFRDVSVFRATSARPSPFGPEPVDRRRSAVEAEQVHGLATEQRLAGVPGVLRDDEQMVEEARSLLRAERGACRHRTAPTSTRNELGKVLWRLPEDWPKDQVGDRPPVNARCQRMAVRTYPRIPSSNTRRQHLVRLDRFTEVAAGGRGSSHPGQPPA